MRRWWIGVVACGAVGVVFACSGGSSDAPIGDGDGGGSSSGASSSGASSSGSSGAPDAAGCLAQGPYSPKQIVSVTRGAGTVPWTSPENAKEPDEKLASADLTGGDSEELRATDFGFDIPPNVIVTGIEVELKRIAPTGGVLDGAVFLVLDGAESPSSHMFVPDWPTTIIGTHKYGTELDDWGMTITPADVMKPTFGATIYVKKADGGGVADIDAIRIFVNYCPPKP